MRIWDHLRSNFGIFPRISPDVLFQFFLVGDRDLDTKFSNTESWHFGFSCLELAFGRLNSKVDSNLSASPKSRFCSESANQDTPLGPDSKPSLFGELETRNGLYRVIWQFATVWDS